MPRIRAPTRRECTRCGRRERWDDDDGHWRIADSEGDVYCVHAWDVTGSFSAVEEDADETGGDSTRHQAGSQDGAEHEG